MGNSAPTMTGGRWRVVLTRLGGASRGADAGCTAWVGMASSHNARARVRGRRCHGPAGIPRAAAPEQRLDGPFAHRAVADRPDVVDSREHARRSRPPTVTTPIVTVPKVTVPTVTVPPVTVPKVTVPKVTVPTPTVSVPRAPSPVHVPTVQTPIRVQTFGLLPVDGILEPRRSGGGGSRPVRSAGRRQRDRSHRDRRRRERVGLLCGRAVTVGRKRGRRSRGGPGGVPSRPPPRAPARPRLCAGSSLS